MGRDDCSDNRGRYHTERFSLKVRDGGRGPRGHRGYPGKDGCHGRHGKDGCHGRDGRDWCMYAVELKKCKTKLCDDVCTVVVKTDGCMNEYRVRLPRCPRNKITFVVPGPVRVSVESEEHHIDYGQCEKAHKVLLHQGTTTAVLKNGTWFLSA